MKQPDSSGKSPSPKPAASLWEGMEMPTGIKRERMEHIDAALQKVRRYDRGEMVLPSAKSMGNELGVGPRTIRRLIEEMKECDHGIDGRV